MAHQDTRDLARDQGRGYAPRVSPAVPSWLRHPSPRTVDISLALLVAALSLPGVVTAAQKEGQGLEAAIIGTFAVLPLLMRRQRPLLALALITVAVVLMPGDSAVPLPLMVALYTIGSLRSWETTIAAAGAVAAVAYAYLVLGGPNFGAGDFLGVLVLCLVASGLGLYVGARRARTIAQRERAVADERLRIAQELHDVVAHNVSLIVVQAQALGATAGDERVREATDGIADLGRQAMREMHRTLKLLRGSDDDPAALAPQPGLGELPQLIERARTAGVGIELAVEGEPRALEQSVDLSAYRIVQEALTNVVKHAGGAPTTVTLGYRPDALELTIADSGNGAPASDSPGGHGLVGMRERAAMFGGTLSAGPRAGRGFEVRASLPYGGAS
jgi:signal transduction histidine kinase